MAGSRLCLWRASHTKSGLKVVDPETGKTTQTFVADEKTVLQAIDTAVSHWVVEKIAGALRDYPEAQPALLKALAEGEDIIQ